MNKRTNIFDLDSEKFIRDFYIRTTGSKIFYMDSVKRIVEFAEIKPNERVLDVGCGNGILVKHITRITNNVTGLDSSPNMIKLATESNPDLRFLISDCCNIAIDRENFDCIVSRALFQHLLKREHTLFLKEAKRLLVDGGRLILFTPYNSKIGMIPRGISNLIINGKRQVCGRNYEYSYIIDVFKKNGFIIEKVEFWGLFLYMISGYGTGIDIGIRQRDLWMRFAKVDNFLTSLPFLRKGGLFLLVRARKAI